jgi:hypothetical protein
MGTCSWGQSCPTWQSNDVSSRTRARHIRLTSAGVSNAAGAMLEGQRND